MFRRSSYAVLAILMLGFALVASDAYAQGRGRGRGLVDALDLTDEQKAAISELRASGSRPDREAVLEILTEEQVDQLKPLRENRRGPRKGHGRRFGRGGFVNALDLTEDQKAAIAELRASGPGPHRDAVLEILTEEQVAQLEALRAERQESRPGMGRGRGRSFIDALDLTPEQEEAIAELRASGPGPHRDAVLEILTEEQVAKLEALRAERQASRMGKQQRQKRRDSGLWLRGRQWTPPNE